MRERGNTQDQNNDLLETAYGVFKVELENPGEGLVRDPELVNAAISCILQNSPKKGRLKQLHEQLIVEAIRESTAWETVPSATSVSAEPSDDYDRYILDFLASRDTTPPH